MPGYIGYMLEARTSLEIPSNVTVVSACLRTKLQTGFSLAAAAEVLSDCDTVTIYDRSLPPIH